jgi:protein gp37
MKTNQKEKKKWNRVSQKFKSGQHGQHDHSFNFWIGCHKFSEGCQNCYMFIAQKRRTIDPENVRLCTSTWEKPRIWQEEAELAGEYRSVFACSYSDFFLPEADAWRNDAWALIRETPNLVWMLASKRTQLIAQRLPTDWGNGYKNVWLGTGAELKKYLPRLDDLRNIPCVLRWLDLAPMLEDLPELAEHIDGFGWVIASGESGCNAVEPRPLDLQWVRNVRDMCSSRDIPFYFSHTGGKARYPGRLLDGVEHNGIPPLDIGYKTGQ